MEKLNAFMRLTKADAAQRMVWGILAAETPDHAREIMDFETAVPAFKAWSAEVEAATGGKSLGNIRAQHGNIVAGVLKEITFDPNSKTIMGKAHIIDDNEWNKVDGGCYSGFSIGGAYAKCWPDAENPKLTRYTPILKEISIVDRPCIPTAKFEYVKADGTSEMRKFQVAEPEVEAGFKAKDGTFFKSEQEAVDHNAALDKADSTPADRALDALQKGIEVLTAKGDAPEQTDVSKAEQAEAAKGEDGKIITEADAKAVIKAVLDAGLSKQLCDLPMIVDVIYSLDWLQSNLAMDALFHDAETASLPTDLKAILASLCAFLKALVEQGVADITVDADAAAKAEGLTEAHVAALRKFTGDDEILKDLTFPAPADPKAEVEAAKAEKADLQKQHDEVVAKLADGIEEMTKGIATLKAANDEATKRNEELAKRIEHLEAQPGLAKGVKYTALLNGQNGSEEPAKPVQIDMRKYNGLSPDEARTQMRKDRQ
ncbi:hypothetical protein [Roseicella sp. DB1501]|uniref:hypothetical protein n=1 Tax=Roseicella sp. DB1501 TaxID=2730925 RepID=UPI001492FDD6|nr:hypothetical protein [Roseicella sp. DB1501]NOG73766.1 hypothetical protein [Roseicella sp. DB1501]